MIKRLLIALLFVASLPVNLSASDSVTAEIVSEINDSQIQIFFDGSKIRVTGASGLNLCVYSITGVRVMNVKVEGADKSYNLNLQRGCYIVKVGNVVRKIAIS